MYKGPAIDVHAHIYPDKIADAATESIGDFYQADMQGSTGSTQQLFKMAQDTPISHFIVHSVAVKAKNVASINKFIAGEAAKDSRLTGFMAMHQDVENLEEEIERAMAAGLKGIKIHPDFQKINLDDDKLMRIYEIAEKKRLPLIIHTGDYRYDYSHPRRMKRVLHEFPDLVVDAAHFGGWSIYDLALEYMEDESCFMDISSSFAFLGKRRTRELIDIYGTERILFGSDFPMWSPKGEFDFFESLGLSDKQCQEILLENPQRFLGFSI